MSLNLISLLFILAMLFPMMRGFISKFSSNNLKVDLREIEKSIAFLIALFLGIYLCKKVFIEQSYEGLNNMANFLFNLTDKKPVIVYIVILPIMVYIIYRIILFVIELINSITFYPLLDGLESYFRNKNSFVKRILGAVFEIPRALCYVMILAFALNFLSITNFNNALNNYLQSSKIYGYVCKEIVIPITNSPLARKLPQVINNSFKIEIRQGAAESVNGENRNKTRQIIYYNGVTLEDGIKSNNSIDSFAIKLVENYKTDKAKARAIYNWIGANIEYDYDKANKVLSNNYSIPSGAIPTFSSKNGICFDYSCLYVAMSRAAGLKVRMVTGEGFNGVSWVSHAWNQVYISEEDKWINVDTTFYKGGNYFNTRRFDVDHRGDNIIGEW